MKLEKQVWNRFRKTWPWYCERIEAWIAFGFPDVVVLSPEGFVGMIELKAPGRLKLRETQVLWHRRWQLNHGRSVVLTYDKDWYWWTGSSVFDMGKHNAAMGGNQGMIDAMWRILWMHLHENKFGPSTKAPSGSSFVGALRKRHAGGVSGAGQPGRG